MSKYCVNCGAELDDEAMFCDECGERQAIHHYEGQTGNQINDNHSNDYQSGVNRRDEYTEIQKPEGNSKLSIASLVMGIISIVSLGALIVPEILGIVFGVMGVKDATKKQGLGRAGIILSVISIVLLILCLM